MTPSCLPDHIPKCILNCIFFSRLAPSNVRSQAKTGRREWNAVSASFRRLLDACHLISFLLSRPTISFLVPALTNPSSNVTLSTHTSSPRENRQESPMNIFQTLDRQDRQYARRRFRGPVRTSLASMILNIREMRKLEEQVLEGSDETVMAFKSSHLNNVGIVAVAVCALEPTLFPFSIPV